MAKRTVVTDVPAPVVVQPAPVDSPPRAHLLAAVDGVFVRGMSPVQQAASEPAIMAALLEIGAVPGDVRGIDRSPGVIEVLFQGPERKKLKVLVG